MLQPDLPITGTTSRMKLTGWSETSLTSTGTSTEWPPTVTTTLAAPFLWGTTNPSPSIVTWSPTALSLATDDRSKARPSLEVPETINRRLSRLANNSSFPGNTVNLSTLGIGCGLVALAASAARAGMPTAIATSTSEATKVRQGMVCNMVFLVVVF